MSKKKEALEPPELRETPERSQHSPVDEIAFKPKGGKAVQTVRRVRYEHPLDVMLHRSLLTDKQFEAGNLFRQHYYRSVNRSRVTSRYDDVTGGSGGIDDEVYSREQVREILGRLTLRQASILIGVCGHGEFATAWAHKLNWKPSKETPMSLLRQALDEAVRVWRL
tara:strand:+ start:209 stop:706 length:498 start_codon:yes stop_codon:yes gene_type:complete